MRHTYTNNSAVCQSYSHVGTSEVDLINLPFIQTANYTKTHNHSLHTTIKSWWREQEQDRGGVTVGGKVYSTHKAKRRAEDRVSKTAEQWKQSEREKGKASGGFVTSKPSTSILLECKLISPLTYSSGLAPSQNLSEKLFVSSIPNKGINVMLMAFQPITALLMDPSVLENVFSCRTLPHGYLCHSLCQVIYGRTLSR